MTSATSSYGAVVMVENVYRHLTEKQDPSKHHHIDKAHAVLYAAKEVGRPIVFGIAIIVIVFLPLFPAAERDGARPADPAHPEAYLPAATSLGGPPP